MCSKNHEFELIKNRGFNLNYECEEYLVDDLVPSDNHTILFNTESLKLHDHIGPPDPLSVKTEDLDQWNDDFVKTPYSESNLNKNSKSQWPETVKCLTKLSETLSKDPDSIYIEYAIKKINWMHSDRWNFDLLHYLFNKEYETSKAEKILKETLPNMIKLAINMPNKIRTPIPILRANNSHSLTISQEQCATILANAFFCTFPERYRHNNPDNMPFINFDGLFSGSGKRSKCKLEKIKCIFNYFERVTTKMPIGVLTFTRNCLDYGQVPEFETSTKPMRNVIIREEGTIEDCIGALQMDFANKYIGGGVLNSGCVQEEIRFMICPELLCSLLFCEVMKSNESILIKGAERFSSYEGYANSFKWAGDYTDETPRDNLKRLYTHVLALDALSFSKSWLQYDKRSVQRELVKCYCGFKSENTNIKKAAIATGNWGCGAFGGDIELKFLIQMIAAAEADRDLIYYTFHDENVSKTLEVIQEIIQNLDTSTVYNIIGQYHEYKSANRHGLTISQFMSETTKKSEYFEKF